MISKKHLYTQSSLFLVCIGLLLAFPSHSYADTTLTACSNCTTSQVQINAALREGGIVHLKKGTYTISSSINLRTGTTLEGEEGVKIVLAPNVKWERYRPIIHGSSIKNARVVNVEVDGNRAENTYPSGVRTWGRAYYRMFFFYKCGNIEIDHSYFHDNWDDIVFTEKTQNLNFHDNVVRNPGHDVISAYHAGTTYVTNNCMKVYGNDGIHVWGGSGPVYAINNNIGVESGAPNFAGIDVQSSGAVAYNCNNTISGLVKAINVGTGATLKEGGCPISPAMATSAQSCNVADIGAPSSTNDYGATSEPSRWTAENAYLSSSNCPNAKATTSLNGETTTSEVIDTGDVAQVSGHMVGGFGAYSAAAMSAVASVGGNTIMNYVSISGGIGSANSRLTSYAAAASSKGLKLIDDVPDQLIRRWHSDRNTSKLLSDLTTHLKWLAENDNVLGHIAGYWMIDDWYSDFGAAKTVLQQMTALIHQYTPNKPAICGFTGNTSYGGSVSGYTKFAANYSPGGCDMVGVYMYPWGSGKIPMTNLANIIAALKNNGWDPSSRPLVGIPQSYGGKYGYTVPTAAQVQQQTKYFCQQGAKHILYYDFNTGTNPTTNATVRSGIKAGIADCQAYW